MFRNRQLWTGLLAGLTGGAVGGYYLRGCVSYFWRMRPVVFLLVLLIFGLAFWVKEV
jgi:hypothetical protein